MRPFFVTIRPKHWIKNGFVLAPLLFSGRFPEPERLLQSALAFLAFCFMASAVYVLNDLADRESDRAHPSKSHRPIASGSLGVPAAVVTAGLLLALSLAIGGLTGFPTLWILLAYFLLNLLYSFFFKSVVLIDVFLIALGFILRLLAGAAAADVGLSAWILVTTFFLSLFLGFAKRKSQNGMEDWSREPDAAGSLYTGEYLNALVIVSMALTVASYSLYTISFMQREGFRSDLMPVTIIFVAYGLFRYLYLIPIREGTGDPVDIVWRDIPILIDIALWLGWVLAVYLLPANQVR